MTDQQFMFLMNLYGGGNGSRFSPGGGTFPPGGGAGSDFSPETRQPFGQSGPGYSDDLGHPMHPLPGGPPTEMTDRNLVHPFDNALALDAGMVQNPDFPFSGGVGNDPKVYDLSEMQDLVSSLRGSSPESLPNPAPPDNYYPGVPYGQRPDIPTYPPSDMVFPPGLADPGDLFNPNTQPQGGNAFSEPGVETISFSGPGSVAGAGGGGEWPALPPDLNFAAPNVPQQTPTPSEFEQVPLTGTNPSGYEPMPFDMFSEVYGQPPGTVGADQLANAPSSLPGSVTADQLANPPGIGNDFQWPFYVDQFPGGNVPPPADTSGPGVAGGAGGTPPTGYYGPSGPNVVGGSNPGLLPNAPGINYAPPVQGIPDANGNIIPGTAVSPEGNANAFNMTQFPGGSGVGGFFKDAAGNIIDATGRMIASAADFAGRFGGSIANLAKAVPGAIQSVGENIADSIPKDWGGFGQPMGFFGTPGPPIAGTFGVNEPGVNRPGAGWAGTGITFNDVAASGVDPNYGNFAPGEVGRSSVPAPASLMPPSTGSINSLGDMWGGIFAKHYLIQMAKGLYTSPQNFGLMKQGMPSPFASQPLGSPMNPGWNWDNFHQGQVGLHDILTQHPEFLQSFLGRGTRNGPPGNVGSPAQFVDRTTVGTPRPVTQ